MTDEFPLFALSNEHFAIRAAVRALCTAKVAPHAAEVDESGAFPQGVQALEVDIRAGVEAWNENPKPFI